MDQAPAEALAAKLAGGHWTHDYALTAKEALALGLEAGSPPRDGCAQPTAQPVGSALGGSTTI